MKNLVFTLSTFIFVSILQAQGYDPGHFEPGYYYDKSDKKIEGFIAYGYDYRAMFKYRSQKDGKTKRIYPTHANSFVIGIDSFILLNKFNIEGVGGSLHEVINDFVEVVTTGKVILYRDYSSQGNPGGYRPYDLANFLLQKDKGEIVLVRHRNKKKFKEQMVEFFKDDIEIVEKIQTEIYKWDDMPRLIKEYNSRHV